jgi:HK97 family phage prohead protease
MGNVDLGGDIIRNGAFRKTIHERMNKIRVVDSHNYDSVMSIVGKPIAMWEVERDQLPLSLVQEFPDATGALMARTQFLMTTPEGRGIFERIKSGSVDEYSIGYDALDTDFEKISRDGQETTIRNLRSIRLWEYGPCVFAMNPATATLSAKDAKPAPDVTENTIRIRVRDPGDFQEGTFRTISIGDEDSGIQATVGKLEGEEDMTVQAYVFDREKWDVDAAQKWVDEHEKGGDGAEEMKDDGTSETPEAALAETPAEAPAEPDDEKAGRVLARRNADRLGAALRTIIDVFTDAGIELDGILGLGEPDEEEDGEKGHTPLTITATAIPVWEVAPESIVMDPTLAAEFVAFMKDKLQEPTAPAPDAEQAVDKKEAQDDTQAGPDLDQTPPTSSKDAMRKRIELELELLEVGRNG